MTTYLGIVPPFLLRAVADRTEGEVADRAAHTLRVEQTLRGQREVRAARATGTTSGPYAGGDVNPAKPAGGGPATGGPGIVPTHMLERIGHEEDRTLRADLGEARRPKHPAPKPTPGHSPAPGSAPAAGPHRTIYDAKHGSSLPGTQVRAEGAAPCPDESANEAYDGLGATWKLFHDVYGRDSLDGRGLPLVASVHYERGYDNAFWNGEQMVFGDGDGQVFASFTDSIDVIGHELTHGLTQFTAGLIYVAQPGALNESISDVFGVLTAQYAAGQTADQADWLIGAKLFMPGVKGVALRSMKSPGTAYDDPRLGKDPQPAQMKDYKDLPHDDTGDNGGVHINSGIPNHAFHLAATALGGHAWEKAGQVWFDTVTAGGLPKDADFATFAGATVKAATQRFGAGAVVDAVLQAWTRVGVTPRSL